MPRTNSHAVVLGAGIAGLLAARVLAPRFDGVTVVERDELTDAATRRRGVPQGSHVHGLVLRGKRTIEALIPGFTHDLIGLGAPTFDFAADFAIRNPFGWAQQFPSDLYAVSASRPLTELVIRRRVMSLPNVTALTQTTATGLIGGHGRIDAVLLRTPGSAEPVPLPADLVVDATGRGSRASRWLAELGYGGFAETASTRMSVMPRAATRFPRGGRPTGRFATSNFSADTGNHPQDTHIATADGHFGETPRRTYPFRRLLIALPTAHSAVLVRNDQR
ncbi:NAD(P)/FAD-dependent oxidoreductase [Nocardia sp. CA-128927]|uniref:NAD(P)/FAD-dependent oxidoreductase n=1 Tax=Nocardia sp. CA-128927 TaxID=3239975 RepID=UPI003D99D52A